MGLATQLERTHVPILERGDVLSDDFSKMCSINQPLSTNSRLKTCLIGSVMCSFQAISSFSIANVWKQRQAASRLDLDEGFPTVRLSYPLCDSLPRNLPC